MLPYLMVSAVVPSFLIMWFFHKRDVFREPAKVLWATFFLGVLTIPAVLITLAPVDLLALEEIENPVLRGFMVAFVHAAIPEELFKFLVLYFYAQRHKAFDEPADGVVYGVAASLGFATLENILYVVGGGMGTAITRAVTAVPGHAFDGAIMGYFVGQAKFRPQERGKLLAASLFWPIVAHGFYDFPLMALDGVESTGLTIFLLLFFLGTFITTAVVALRLANRLRREQLAWLRQRQAAFAHAAPAPHAPMAAAPLQAQPAPHAQRHGALPGPGGQLGHPGPIPQRAQPPMTPPGAGHAGPLQARIAAGMPPQPLPGAHQGQPYPPQPPRWPAAPAGPPKQSRLSGWLLLLGSVPLAGFGGLMTLGGLLAFDSGDVGFVILLGFLPLGLGAFMFIRAMKIFNRS